MHSLALAASLPPGHYHHDRTSRARVHHVCTHTRAGVSIRIRQAVGRRSFALSPSLPLSTLLSPPPQVYEMWSTDKARPPAAAAAATAALTLFTPPSLAFCASQQHTTRRSALQRGHASQRLCVRACVHTHAHIILRVR
ncbi:hypothetical protein EGR_06656 [Echinococcus granulosus]|uniref:Uncharacterized protein n=1 Tax=Echinococcus granulosus TaxID=6210 RepID=W6UBK5_ECHGR|nr:hypothetical protein EGR_06656 [Echinococcus granulosus]EUB58475.1 hypothetical protein EGR_06656 [Echinococcus granulosus]